MVLLIVLHMHKNMTDVLNFQLIESSLHCRTSLDSFPFFAHQCFQLSLHFHIIATIKLGFNYVGVVSMPVQVQICFPKPVWDISFKKIKAREHSGLNN